jgi:O-antigen/teichoic acid export membrane protein
MLKFVLRNSATSVGQTVINALTQFVTYRILIQLLGPAKFGAWSLLTAASAVVRLGDLGFANGIVRCVARALAIRDHTGAREAVFTGAALAMPFNTVAAAIGYPIVRWLILYSIKDAGLRSSVEPVAPVFILALWLQMLTSVPQAALDGCQRFDLRNGILVIGSAISMPITWIAVRRAGLLGAAYSQVGLWALVLCGLWLAAVKTIPGGMAGAKLSRTWARELAGYGWKFQFMQICGLTCDPATKSLLAHFGGINQLAYYELASRLVSSLRSIIGAANQVLVPAVAHLNQVSVGQLPRLYRAWFSTITVLSMTAYGCTAAAAPLISIVWLGRYSRDFVIFTCIAAFGMAINTAGLPAYLTNIGTGRLRWNVIAHVTIALLNPVLGFGLGNRFGGFGVGVGSALALAVGSALMIDGQVAASLRRVTYSIGVWVSVLIMCLSIGTSVLIAHEGRYLHSCFLFAAVALTGLFVGWRYSSLSTIAYELGSKIKGLSN